MKSNTATMAFLLLCIIIFGFGMNACGGNATRDRFEYTERDINAKINGTVDGDDVNVVLKSRPDAGQGEYDLTLTFESPDALGGLVISHNTNGSYEARLGELIMHDFKADGLFEPFLTLLYHGEIASVFRDSEGHTTFFVKQEGIDLEYLFLKGSAYPYSIKGSLGDRKIELFVQRLDLS